MKRTNDIAHFQNLGRTLSNIIRTGTAVIMLLLFTLSGISVAATVVWQYRPGAGYTDTSPAIADLDDDGIKDLVACTTAGRVLALDASGRTKWSYDTGWTISSPPTIASMPEPRVFVISNSGIIACLDGKTGALLWEFNMPSSVGWGTTAIAAADINSDGKVEIVAGDSNGHLVCLGGDGSPLWMKKHKDGINTAPALVDLDGDGHSEILVGTTMSPLVCFSNKGVEKWRLKESGAVGSSPVVCDVNGDGQPEIVVGRGNGVSLVSRKGKVLWHHRMRKQVHDAIAVGDVDNDGSAEIVVADLFGQVACLQADGGLRWTANVEQRVRRSPAIADIDGDLMPEVIVGGYSPALYIFDGDGNLKERYPLRASMNASPTIVDFKKDRNLNVICATMAEVVALSWLKTAPKVQPPVYWAEYRANSARTGSVFTTQKAKRIRIADVDYGDLYVGSNIFRVTVENPRRQPLSLQLEFARDGGLPVRTKFASSDSVFSGQLPYSIAGQSAVNLKFTFRLFSGKRLLFFREQKMYIIPFSKDLADLKKSIFALKQLVADLPDQQYIGDRLMLFSTQLAQLEQQTKLAGTLSTLERSALRDRMAQLRNEVQMLLTTSRAAIKAGASLAVFAANPWAPFGGMEEIVEGRMASPDFNIEAFGGEVESAALNLVNFSSRPLNVRIEIDPILCQKDSSVVPARNVISLHEVLDVPTQELDLSADALPRLGQANTMIIPARSARQLWLNVNVSHLTPGQWSTSIRFRTLQVESQQVVSRGTITVWNAHLPEKQPLKLCHWGYVHTSILKDQPEAALEDQIRHGTNVFVATNTFAPKADFDENGDLVSDIDFSQHDEYVRRHAPFGTILFFNYQWALKGPAEVFSPKWTKAYKQWLKAWFDHLRAMGIDYDNFALYPIDEPGLRPGLVDKFIAYAKPIREVDAKVQIYTDPVARASMADLKKMAPFVDIWCPNRNGYLLDKGAEKLAFIKSTGKTVWTYECEGNAKHQSPLGYYRGQAWLVWHHGLSGIGFWSYCTSRFDPWFVPAGGQDYLLIYQGNGVVSSKRWEAVRDGIEDFSMLTQLKKAVQKASGKKALAAEVKKANRILKTEASTVAQYCGLDEYGTQPGVGGMKKVRQVEDARWQKILTVRREIARLLDALEKEE